MTTSAHILLGSGEQNLITATGLSDLHAQVRDAIDQRQPICFSGATPGRFFCGGFDLDDLLKKPDAEIRTVFEELLVLTRRVFSAPVPVLTMAQGHAVGVGAMLALASDRCVMAPKAKMRFPEVVIGLGTLGDIVDLLRYRTTARMAERMAALAQPVTAGEAVSLGLVDALAAEGLEAEAELAVLTDGLDREAFLSAKEICRRGMLPTPIERQLDAFMPGWSAYRAKRSG